MPEAVDEVVGEGEAEEGELEQTLDEEGQGGGGGDEGGGLEVPADDGGDEVGGEVGVGGAGEDAAGDTGPGGGGEPGLLDLVDAEMGSDGAVQTLLVEDVGALGLRDLGGGSGTSV